MSSLKYDKDITAVLGIDPYNDFISEGGKAWDRLKSVAEANDCVPHMLEVLNAAREAGLRVFYALHHRYEFAYVNWPTLLTGMKRFPRWTGGRRWRYLKRSGEGTRPERRSRG